MRPEQRFDRLERMVRLLAHAGLRFRRREREQDEKINMIIEAQVKNEERFARLAEAQVELAISQAHSDQRLDALISIIRDQRNGKSN